jgi:hypothetical protein
LPFKHCSFWTFTLSSEGIQLPALQRRYPRLVSASLLRYHRAARRRPALRDLLPILSRPKLALGLVVQGQSASAAWGDGHGQALGLVAGLPLHAQLAPAALPVGVE